MKAFEYRSRAELLKETAPHLPGEDTSSLRSHFEIVPASVDVIPSLRSRLRHQPGVVRVLTEGCPVLAHEGGSNISTVSHVVSAFASEGVTLKPLKLPKGTQKPIIPTPPGGALLVPPNHAFFVFVGSSAAQTHAFYKEFTSQDAAGGFDLRQGNVYVSGSDLTRSEQTRVRSAMKTLSSD